MAQLTITVDNALVARVVAAYGVTTASELKQVLIREIKAKVKTYETQQAKATATTTFNQAQDAYAQAIRDAETKAESEIILT